MRDIDFDYLKQDGMFGTVSDDWEVEKINSDEGRHIFRGRKHLNDDDEYMFVGTIEGIFTVFDDESEVLVNDGRFEVMLKQVSNTFANKLDLDEPIVVFLRDE